MYITASLLHNYLICPHRVWRDRYGPQEEKEESVNPFVQLLWEKGVRREEDVIDQISTDQYLDLRGGHWRTRFDTTLEAIDSGIPLIYQGVLHYKNMIGIPDLLQRTKSGDYLAIDIKSGRGYKKVGGNNLKRKNSYAVQICMYIELLQKLGLSRFKHGYIHDIDDRLIRYSSAQPMGERSSKSWQDFYLETKNKTLRLLKNQDQNKPALSGHCSLCPWLKSCGSWCRKKDDLTKIFYLGQSKRDVLNKDVDIKTVKQAASIDLEEELIKKKKHSGYLYGIGRKTLRDIIRRADILGNEKKPVLYKKIHLPKVEHELYFDIEDDPTQSFIYLHGFYYRNSGEEKYIYFLAKKLTEESERKAWKETLVFIDSLPKGNFAIYYYSNYEKTVYKRLSQKYPEVANEPEIERLFSHKYTVDLYSDIILRATDWPLSSYSLKEIATYLGFNWRDDDPSGANSILWYSKHLETGSTALLQRILDYNEDDCKATMVIKDKLSEFNQQI